MRRRNFVKSVLASVALVAGTVTAEAASELVTGIQTHLYAGETAAAAALAEERLAANPGDDEARYALGTVQFLQAVEHLGQALYRYGLNSAEQPLAGLAGLPFVRLPVPANPAPEKIDYDKFRDVLTGFVGDLGTAESTLAQVGSESLDLPLSIAAVKLDFDGDGSGSEEESLLQVLNRLSGPGSLPAEAASSLTVDFDASDVPWLRAYCHLLTAIAEFPLAHDWRTAFDATFHGAFPQAGLPMSAVESAEPSFGMPRVDAVADLIAFIHLLHWPVAEPERMRSVLAHLEAVPPLSRENWRRILAETDSGKEWLPNPRQTGMLPGMTVTQEQIDGWLLFLSEAEALLAGRKLLPHWRFADGINLRRIFTEPTTFDLVLLIQGSAALPYLEQGELTDPRTWRQMNEMLGRNFFRYALWFN